NLVPQVATV
nr:Chain P, HCMV pp65 fragment 495-503, variant M5Q (NLVPQVATV) [synthetic construct]